MNITFGGDPVTLVGTPLQVGDTLPSAKVVTMDMEEVDMLSFENKIKVISMAPSLDTGVCDLQTKGFITRLDKDPDVTLVTVSMDLPFAQKRWCGAAGAETSNVVSDYRYREVGTNFGTLIDSLKLLTRAVFVVDENNVIQYVEYVPEVKTQVNFDAAMEAINKLK